MLTERAPSLSVAVAQPVVTAGDLRATVAAHADAVRASGARLVVFPEMSLTGYDLDAPAVDLADDALAPLVAACHETGAVALVGAPVAEGERESIAMLRFDADGVRVVYRKVWLHGSESQRFTPGPGAATTDVDGWRVGLAICRDTGQSRHTAQVARLGVDLVAAGVVDLPEDLEECRARAFVIARTTGAPVAVASFAGPTGGGFDETAGCSSVHDARGELVTETGPTPGTLTTATLT
ncbi:carbon-nitrogen hydrolase family protein [Cellulomonas palmilytica]|uniref:carbon-nitrogen hydrolase family protein n=1 Tax=Cellulomonas palmilytica TaxID=2608402 RepID=UPI001F31A723|nr:carbon-nitrogen hydrolase family protein [Cellulomonas palmilytica]